MTQERNKIIIVDDDEDLLAMLVDAFESEGYEVHGMTRGKEALSYLMEEKNIETAALLILDRLLPDMDGLEILRQFVEKYQKRVPVLILSVLSGERDVLSGLKQGAIDYISKPFNFPIMMEKSLSLIKQRR